jgi:superfamily II DNA or RNA helicase
VKLWSHQAAAADDFCGTVGDGERGTVVAACGSGKTLIAAEVSVRVAPDEPVVVTVPTVELLAQTLREWRAYLGAGAGRLVAVCDEGLLRLAARHAGVGLRDGLSVTTDPGYLATLLGDGRVTVAATYASLPVLRAAFASPGARRAGLLVVDEAHRTAGVIGKPWAMVHDQVAIPARRRLYMTATPKLVVDDDEPVISMDDAKLYGPVVHRLGFADAIRLGLLAEYRLVVGIVTREELAGQKWYGEDIVRVEGQSLPMRMLASQIALGRAITEYQLRRALTYHSRIASADQYATTLPGSLRLLPDGERPEREVAAWSVSSKSKFAHRARVLASLRDVGDRCVVVSNARLFTEGVDVPALDAVVFDDPRSSPIDVVQGIGRTLRRGDKQDKIATIVAPILTTKDEIARGLDQKRWRVVWQVIRALQAHDERVETQIAEARRVERKSDYSGSTWVPPWLTTIGPGVPEGVAEQIRLEVVNPHLFDEWARQYAVAQKFHAEHGHLRVPSNTEDPDLLRLMWWLEDQRPARQAGRLRPDQIALLDRLGFVWAPHEQRWQAMFARYEKWLADGNGHEDVPDEIAAWRKVQRHAHRGGTLPEHRKAKLDSIGMPWEAPPKTRWMQGLEHAKAYRRKHGHLDVPYRYVTDDGFALGHWIRRNRTDETAGTLRPSRKALLEQIGMVWDAHAWRFQQGVAVLRAFHEEHGHIRLPTSHSHYQWLATIKAKRRRGKLTTDQLAQLDVLGMASESRQTDGQADQEPSTDAPASRAEAGTRERARPAPLTFQAPPPAGGPSE